MTVFREVVDSVPVSYPFDGLRLSASRTIK